MTARAQAVAGPPAVPADAASREAVLIESIADRAVQIAARHGRCILVWLVYNDVMTVHRGPCRLDLDRLLAASDSDFAHDVFGIEARLNRQTRTLEGCFRPRFHARAEAPR